MYAHDVYMARPRIYPNPDNGRIEELKETSPDLNPIERISTDRLYLLFSKYSSGKIIFTCFSVFSFCQ